MWKHLEQAVRLERRSASERWRLLGDHVRRTNGPDDNLGLSQRAGPD